MIQCKDRLGNGFSPLINAFLFGNRHEHSEFRHALVTKSQIDKYGYLNIMKVDMEPATTSAYAIAWQMQYLTAMKNFTSFCQQHLHIRVSYLVMKSNGPGRICSFSANLFCCANR